MSQHQGLDAILEEVNKALKALVPPVPMLKHWEIAARNCIKFLMVIIINIICLHCKNQIFFTFIKFFTNSFERNYFLQLAMQIMKVQVFVHAQTLKKNHSALE